eukprot:gene14005-biopygen8261
MIDLPGERCHAAPISDRRPRARALWGDEVRRGWGCGAGAGERAGKIGKSGNRGFGKIGGIRNVLRRMFPMRISGIRDIGNRRIGESETLTDRKTWGSGESRVGLIGLAGLAEFVGLVGTGPPLFRVHLPGVGPMGTPDLDEDTLRAADLLLFPYNPQKSIWGPPPRSPSPIASRSLPARLAAGSLTRSARRPPSQPRAAAPSAWTGRAGRRAARHDAEDSDSGKTGDMGRDPVPPWRNAGRALDFPQFPSIVIDMILTVFHPESLWRKVTRLRAAAPALRPTRPAARRGA